MVDDNVDSARMYGEYLSAAGFASLHARTALDALQIACEWPLHAVVTSVRLAGPTDGVELVRELRSEPRTRNVRIVVLSGSIFDLDRDAAVGAG
jgi:CheY-like chemotaxis protein